MVKDIILTREEAIAYGLKGYRNVFVYQSHEDLVRVSAAQVANILGGEDGVIVATSTKALIREVDYQFQKPANTPAERKKQKKFPGRRMDLVQNVVFQNLEFPTESLDRINSVMVGFNECAHEIRCLAACLLGDVIDKKLWITKKGSMFKFDDRFTISIGRSSTGNSLSMDEVQSTYSAPEKIWGVDVTKGDIPMETPMSGIILYDDFYPVAELTSRGIYIHHKLFEEGNLQELAIFRMILEQARVIYQGGIDNLDATYAGFYKDNSLSLWVQICDQGFRERVQYLQSTVGHRSRKIFEMQRELQQLRREQIVDKNILAGLEGNAREREEKHKEAFEKILAIDEVVSVVVYPHAFVMQTKEMVATDIQHPHTKYRLGSYTVTIPFGEGKIGFVSDSPTKGGHHHPHISKGDICKGDFEETLYKYNAEGDYYTAAMQAINFLQHCNSRSPLVGMEEWGDRIIRRGYA